MTVEFKNSSSLYEWSEEMKFSIAKAQLRGKALKWLMSKSVDIRDFETFETAFRSTFLLTQSVTEKLRVMMAREQSSQRNSARICFG